MGFAEVLFEGRSIEMEFRWLNPEKNDAPLIVFLHGGVGSLAMWKEYPQALCDAGGFRGLALSGLVLDAAHIFMEDITICGAELARSNYLNSDLKQKLSRYHADVDSAFLGWNDMWLNPEFRHWNIEGLLGAIHCPVLAIQGDEDEYGTMAQLDCLKRQVPHARLLKLASCHHSPHREQPHALTRAVVGFIRSRWNSSEWVPGRTSACRHSALTLRGCG